MKRHVQNAESECEKTSDLYCSRSTQTLKFEPHTKFAAVESYLSNQNDLSSVFSFRAGFVSPPAV